ncbi:lymphocyte expansion molecule-like [Ischnura elegans]|uniref:lymphocyte expansion molecule-like n=1 Tax=Ischnura elegans TaxID=197161 RepID=UPI001ED89415|nr:lymphocyte expansion molecule-like [Ischnura elegans]
MLKRSENFAFGSSCKRFNNKGLHPNLGLTNEYTKIAPGENQKLNDWSKKKIPGSKWIKSEVKEEMKLRLQLNLLSLTPDATSKRPSRKIPNTDRPARIGNSQGALITSKNLPKDYSMTPGPGFYGKGHIASQRFEDWSRNRKFPVDMRSTKLNRYPEYEIAPGWKMTPAQYEVKDRGSIQALLDRRITEKGPYQLFTGERDNTTLTGHWAAPKFKGSATMFYELPSEMNRLNHPSKYFVGKWIPLSDLQILQRLEKSRSEEKYTQRHLIDNISCVSRDALEPGPAHYNPRELGEIRYGFHPPFLNRDKSVRGIAHFIKDTPGPSRYNKVDKRNVNGHRNVFLSKVPRTKMGRK